MILFFIVSSKRRHERQQATADPFSSTSKKNKEEERYQFLGALLGGFDFHYRMGYKLLRIVLMRTLMAPDTVVRYAAE